MGMGYLIYANTAEYEIEDRTLSHVKVAVVAKLRRQESFLLSWGPTSSDGSGRISLWLSPSIPLQFRFSGSRAPELNPAWLQALAHSANGTRGMIVMTEKEAELYLSQATP